MSEDHDICKNCAGPIRRDRYPNGEVGIWLHAVTEDEYCGGEPPRATPVGGEWIVKREGASDECRHDWAYADYEYGGRRCKLCGLSEDSGGLR